MEEIKLKLRGADNFSLQEAYKTLRTNLQFCGQDIQTIVITSCNENEGKTTIALNLAASMAEMGKRVLFMDADMRKSMVVGRYTESKNLLGLSEVLSGQESLQNCVYSCQKPGLDLLFAGKYPPNPAELLSSKYFPVLLENSKEVYDYVIIDTPPLGRVIDAAVIAAHCDGAVMVIGSSATTIREAQNVVAQLKKSGCNILGVARNFVSSKNSRYYKKY